MKTKRPLGVLDRVLIKNTGTRGTVLYIHEPFFQVQPDTGFTVHLKRGDLVRLVRSDASRTGTNKMRKMLRRIKTVSGNEIKAGESYPKLISRLISERDAALAAAKQSKKDATLQYEAKNSLDEQADKKINDLTAQRDMFKRHLDDIDRAVRQNVACLETKTNIDVSVRVGDSFRQANGQSVAIVDEATATVGVRTGYERVEIAREVLAIYIRTGAWVRLPREDAAPQVTKPVSPVILPSSLPLETRISFAHHGYRMRLEGIARSTFTGGATIFSDHDGIFELFDKDADCHKIKLAEPKRINVPIWWRRYYDRNLLHSSECSRMDGPIKYQSSLHDNNVGYCGCLPTCPVAIAWLAEQTKTVCASCRKPFAPPIGLFGTNDVACPHCHECYTAVSPTDPIKPSSLKNGQNIEWTYNGMVLTGTVAYTDCNSASIAVGVTSGGGWAALYDENTERLKIKILSADPQ